MSLSPRQRRLHISASLHHQNLLLAQWKIQYHQTKLCQTEGTAIAMQFWHFGEANMLAGWTTKGFAVHWASHFKLHTQPDRQYPPMLSEFIFCCWSHVAIQATTIHSTYPDEEETDQQITYPKCTDGVMLKDGFQ